VGSDRHGGGAPGLPATTYDNPQRFQYDDLRRPPLAVGAKGTEWLATMRSRTGACHEQRLSD